MFAWVRPERLQLDDGGATAKAWRRRWLRVCPPSGTERQPTKQGGAALLPAVALACLLCSGCDGVSELPGKSLEEPASPIVTLAPEVDAVLRRQLELLQPLATDPRILSRVRRANLKHAELEPSQIDELEREFQDAPVDSPLLRSLLQNPAAEALKEFQRQHPGYSEIFVTDHSGLIVAATNKTTDYYQADERWWKAALLAGPRYGTIEYDQSSQTEAVSLYLPIRAPEKPGPIGVLKAVFRLEAIVEEL